MHSEKQRHLRHRQIIKLVESGQIGTQSVLMAALKRLGIKVSQSTLSKDIKEMGVVKVPAEDGGFRYVLGERLIPRKTLTLERALMGFLIEFHNAGNLLVLKTTSGHAQGVAVALDEAHWEPILGTVAGDDTILVVCSTADEAQQVTNRIRELIGE